MKISNEKQYNSAFKQIDRLIAENFEESVAKQKEFRELAEAIREYEKMHYPILNTQINKFNKRVSIRN